MVLAMAIPCASLSFEKQQRILTIRSSSTSRRLGMNNDKTIRSLQCMSTGSSIGSTFTHARPLDFTGGIYADSLFGSQSLGIGNGSRWYLMRHGKRVPKLNKAADQRKALLRGLTTQLLRHGRIKTTHARAKAVRPYVDHMITLAKGGSLHQRRQALGYIYDKQLVHALFAEVPDRYNERNGGYTRVIRTMPRRGDNAPMAYIELV